MPHYIVVDIGWGYLNHVTRQPVLGRKGLM